MCRCIYIKIMTLMYIVLKCIHRNIHIYTWIYIVLKCIYRNTPYSYIYICVYIYIERERERERQRDRETERDRDRETERENGRKPNLYSKDTWFRMQKPCVHMYTWFNRQKPPVTRVLTPSGWIPNILCCTAC
jgi:hypothetical protein